MSVAQEIERLEAKLNEGTKRVTTDGLSVSYDLGEIRNRLLELRRQQDATRRPRVAGIDLSRAW